MGMGFTRWCVPDMYLPAPHDRAVPSHETVCLTNTGSEDARVTMTALFEDDRQPVIISGIVVGAMRSLHIRMDCLGDYGAAIPVGVPYSLIAHSDEPIVLEYSRLNWIDGEATTFAVMGYGEN